MEKQEENNKKKSSGKKLIAKKDHLIVQNEVRIEIKKGDEVKVPKKFLEVLKTEKVI
jgi:hypothetical protein